MKCKRKTDGRKLDHKALESLRIHTVQRILDGESPEVLAEALGLNRATIYRWLNKYHLWWLGCTQGEAGAWATAEALAGADGLVVEDHP